MLSFSPTRNPKSFFSVLLSVHSPPSLYLCLGLPWPRGRTCALGLIELHEFCTAPPLKPVRVPLDGVPSLQHVDCTTQLGVTSKLAEGALNPIVHVTNKDVSASPSTDPWRVPLIPCLHLDTKPLMVILWVWPSRHIPYPASGPSVKSTSLQFGYKDVVWDSVKCFAQVQVYDISCSCLIHQLCSPIVGGHQICQTWFALSAAMLGVTNHLNLDSVSDTTLHM